MDNVLFNLVYQTACFFNQHNSVFWELLSVIISIGNLQ